jgi:FkbM family methyltransferase
MFPDAALYCIEPLQQPRHRLEQVLRSHGRLVILPQAAAATAETRAFHVSRETDSSSLLEITNNYTAAFPGTEEEETVDVDAAPLDELVAGDIERPCLLKIDAQGSELEVLAGATRLLSHVDEIFVECSFVEFYRGQPLVDDIVVELHSRGFRLDGVFSVVRDGRGHCLQADLLFGRAEAGRGIRR